MLLVQGSEPAQKLLQVFPPINFLRYIHRIRQFNDDTEPTPRFHATTSSKLRSHVKADGSPGELLVGALRVNKLIYHDNLQNLFIRHLEVKGHIGKHLAFVHYAGFFSKSRSFGWLSTLFNVIPFELEILGRSSAVSLGCPSALFKPEAL
jgi:hypothetical protein